MLPLANALEVTGGSELIVGFLLDVVGEANPSVMAGALFLLTALLGLVLSNTASAVLVAPIAITAAETMQVSPYPFCNLRADSRVRCFFDACFDARCHAGRYPGWLCLFRLSQAGCAAHDPDRCHHSSHRTAVLPLLRWARPTTGALLLVLWPGEVEPLVRPG